jgi:formylglycine-generating enzyme required for sulfatase activity
VLVVVALAVTDVLTLAPSANPERGIQALREGHWQEAARLLEQLSPDDSDAVRTVALILDDTTVLVQGGVLRMGLDDGALDQQPAHDVPVAALQIDRFEVTNAQYQVFVGATGHRAPRGWSNGRFARGTALYPVTGVTQRDALAFAAWAGKRLPTEAEWEWAARGREGRLYPWGDEAAAGTAHTQPPEHRSAALVASYPTDRTPLGVYDLAGNVREWTADVYAPYRTPHAPPASGATFAVRGSSWHGFTDALTARGKLSPDAVADDLGFRCIR